MNIASLIVRARPEHLDGVRTSLLALPGVDIHHVDPRSDGQGRLIVTVEDTADAGAADTVMVIHRLDHVLSATMVFQYAATGAAPS